MLICILASPGGPEALGCMTIQVGTLPSKEGFHGESDMGGVKGVPSRTWDRSVHHVREARMTLGNRMGLSNWSVFTDRNHI